MHLDLGKCSNSYVVCWIKSHIKQWAHAWVLSYTGTIITEHFSCFLDESQYWYINGKWFCIFNVISPPYFCFNSIAFSMDCTFSVAILGSHIVLSHLSDIIWVLPSSCYQMFLLFTQPSKCCLWTYNSPRHSFLLMYADFLRGFFPFFVSG